MAANKTAKDIAQAAVLNMVSVGGTLESLTFSNGGDLTMPAPLVQALIAHFNSVFEGLNGDCPAVLEAVAGVSVTQALWKPTPPQNSIWRQSGACG